MLGDSFLLSPTADDEIQNRDKQIKDQRRTVHIYHELALVCVYHDREKTDNFSVDVIYSRYRIVYTCGIQSVSTVNRSKQMSVCVWLSTMCLSNCLSVCPCVCVPVCIPFCIIIICAQIVQLYSLSIIMSIMCTDYCSVVVLCLLLKVNKRRRRKWNRKKQPTNPPLLFQHLSHQPTVHKPTHEPSK